MRPDEASATGGKEIAGMQIKTKARIAGQLAFVFGADAGSRTFEALEKLLRSYEGRIKPRKSGWSEKDTLLITYADSILGPEPPVKNLHGFLRKEMGDLISFVHLLPFYPFSSDDGFAVQDFRAVRPDLGTWEDIRHFAEDYRLVFDGVINHVSASGIYMQKYCQGDPAFADFFVALDPSTDTSKVMRTRNTPLLHDYETSAGKRWLWTTFSRDQVDLNFANPKVLIEIVDVLLFYAMNGASMVRLDAIPYMWKQLGTSCVHLPQAHELIKLLHCVFDIAAPHVLLLTETNVPHKENVTYFGDHGDEAQMIYNFALAPLVLWTIVKGNATVLTEWASGIRKVADGATYLNITATHDGIGMRPTEGLLPESDRMELVQLARRHNGDITGKRNSDGSISPYEINLNYFDAVNDPTGSEPLNLQILRFVLSQAITLSLIGIPGLYIHSLLGSRNYTEGVEKTGRARTINREQLSMDMLAAALADPNSLHALVFSQIKRLLQVRSTQSAFHPDADQEIPDQGPRFFMVRRINQQTGKIIVALHNVTNGKQTVSTSSFRLGNNCQDILTNESFDSSVSLAPYQFRWLKSSDSSS
jgi:sucrose phosphorylase